MVDFLPDELDVLNRVRMALETAPPGTFVIAGGWAARLLRRHPLARSLGFAALATQDLDIAAPNRRRTTGRVGDELVVHGFAKEFRSEDHPPVIAYAFANGMDVEFIAPWVPRRPGDNSTTLEIHGAVAQTAKHVEILLVEPCTITVDGVGSLTVASPSSYLIQKALSLWDRPSPQKRAKDTLYLWEVISLFSPGPRLELEVIEAARRLKLTRSQLAIARAAQQKLSDPRHPVVREAAEQARRTQRPVSAEALALALEAGLTELFDLSH